jgi:hypothetical protein
MNIKWKITFKYIIFFICFPDIVLAQNGIRNESANIVITNGGFVTITGNGSWTNNVTTNCITGNWMRFARKIYENYEHSVKRA